MPPHLGIGGSVGFTTMGTSGLTRLAGFFGYSLSASGKTYLPAYAAELRIGGLFLPFDLGFKYGYINPIKMGQGETKVNFLLAGGDIRYALLDRPILPKISIGVGLNYLEGGVQDSVGISQRFYYGNGRSFVIESPDVKLEWDTFSLDFKAQISKSLLIITPYIGAGGTYSWSNAGYSVNTRISCAAGPITQQEINEIKEYLKLAGLEDIDLSETKMSSSVDDNALNFRLFGGFSVNLLLFRIDLTGLYNFLDGNYGASLGLRFQL